MVGVLTTSLDPIQVWHRKALSELERAVGQSVDLWYRNRDEGWLLSDDGSAHGNSSLADEQEPEAGEDLLALMDSTTTSGIATVLEQAGGSYLLVIPLGEKVAATTTVRTDSPRLLLGLAELGSSYFKQQSEVAQLREENDFFLKQVSDDFEELTFLRSMAQRLGLGDSTNTLEQLIQGSISELGKSTHAEELYFVPSSEDTPEILAQWQADGFESNGSAAGVAIEILKQYRDAAPQQPLIKNGFDMTPEGTDYRGVRDFVIVPVGDSTRSLGWFLAINRLSEEGDDEARVPEWRLNQHEFGTSEASLLSTAAAMIASHANNLSLFQERELLLVNVVRTLVSAVEAKDEYTCGHSERVALYAKRLAEQVGYSEEDCELLYLTGLLHDVGKIAINDAILNKPDRLTDEEFAEIQRHPEEGWNILQGLDQLNYVLPGVLHHHERIDGKGYPDGLTETKIPLDGRILAVADAYDAMTSNRAYRTGMPHEKAIGILRDGAGTQWDSEAIHAFLEIQDDITSIRESYQPREKPIRKAADSLDQ